MVLVIELCLAGRETLTILFLLEQLGSVYNQWHRLYLFDESLF